MLLGAWIVWAALDVVAVSVAYGTHQFACSILIDGWAADVPWARWTPAAIGIVVAVRNAGAAGSARVARLSQAVFALTVARLLSLIPAVGSLFPPVGLLWSAHASWALSFALFLFATAPVADDWLERRRRAAAFVLLASLTLVYAAYGVFFVRTTILHGDEPQYLMITQSLLRDGDIDLSDTAPDDLLAFHQVSTIEPHKAAASPQGKVHNRHPVGIAALIAPAYALGEALLDHPRLTSALSVCVITAVAVFLLYHLMLAAGFGAMTALVVAVSAAGSPVLFLYSNQIYPDTAALAATLPALIVSLSKRNPGRLGVVGSLTLALLLPFLHPRMLPLTLLLAGLLWLRVRQAEDRRFVLRAGGALCGAAFVGIVAYHLHYTGDVWGAYKPGNAWDVYTIDPSVTAAALFGQWIDAHVGLLANAPMFGLAVPGLILMLIDRKRAGVIALLVYGMTACVNANSDDWRFGFCFPTRFMITALPALMIPLAAMVSRGLKRDPAVLILFTTGVAVSVDTVLEALKLTESAFLGMHLVDRDIASVYPLELHLPQLGKATAFPWVDALVWGFAGIAPAVLMRAPFSRPRLVVGAVAMALCAVSGIVVDYGSRMDGNASPRLQRHGPDRPGRRPGSVEKRAVFTPEHGILREGALYVAREGMAKRGVVSRGALPYLVPSLYAAVIPVAADGPPRDVLGSYVVAERASVRAYGNHEVRHSQPITPESQAGFHRLLRVSGKATLYHFVTYEGAGELAFGAAKIGLNLQPITERATVIFEREIPPPAPGDVATFKFVAPNLAEGFYRIGVELEDVDPAVWVDRRTDPVIFVVFPGHLEEGKDKLARWAPMLGRAMEAVPPDGAERPIVEAYLSPYWSMVPVLGRERMQFDFENTSRRDLYIAGLYFGDRDLRMKSVRVQRLKFDARVNGEVGELRLRDPRQVVKPD